MPTKPDCRLPVGQAARLFELLADKTRLRLLLLLLAAGEGGMTAGDLAKALRISQPALSRHLHWLRLAGAVTCRREGRSAGRPAHTNPA
jgi:DNA-binding transcriptional ArsR family regulator